MLTFSHCCDTVVDLDVDDMLTLLHSCQIDFVLKSKKALISRYFDYVFGEHVATLFWKPAWTHTPVPTRFQQEFVNMNFIFIDAATQMRHVPRSLKKGPMVTALKSIHPFMRPLFWRNMRISCWHALVCCILSHASYLVSLTGEACLKIFSMLKPYDDILRFCVETGV